MLTNSVNARNHNVIPTVIVEAFGGYRRIRGVLLHARYKLAVSTIAEILRQHGIEPASERSRKTSWKESQAQHWGLIVAVDFL